MRYTFIQPHLIGRRPFSQDPGVFWIVGIPHDMCVQWTTQAACANMDTGKLVCAHMKTGKLVCARIDACMGDVTILKNVFC